jgi:hypothetical protein
MNLAIFDIDGTLTDTNGVDDRCFIESLALALAITGIDTDWAGYPHTTDSGIMLRIFQERFGRGPVPDEIEAARAARRRRGFVKRAPL